MTPKAFRMAIQRDDAPKEIVRFTFTLLFKEVSSTPLGILATLSARV
jgi:hypothetical protein